MLNYCGVSSLSPAELAQQARRMARFFDLGGHERFSKTLLHGLTTLLPDCAMLCVSAASGGWAPRRPVNNRLLLFHLRHASCSWPPAPDQPTPC